MSSGLVSVGLVSVGLVSSMSSGLVSVGLVSVGLVSSMSSGLVSVGLVSVDLVVDSFELSDIWDCCMLSVFIIYSFFCCSAGLKDLKSSNLSLILNFSTIIIISNIIYLKI